MSEDCRLAWNVFLGVVENKALIGLATDLQDHIRVILDNTSYLRYLAFTDEKAKIVDSPKPLNLRRKHMSIYRRGGVYWSRIMDRGKVYTTSLKTSNLKDARRFEATLRTRIAEGNFGLVKPVIPTVSEFSEQFLNFLPSRVGAKTFSNYNGAWQRLTSFEKLASARLNEIDGPLMNEYTSHMQKNGAAVSSINLDLRVLSRALNLAKEWGVIKTKPRMHLLRGENQREYVLSGADEQKIGDALVNGLVKLMVPFLIDTGLRPVEAVNLTWDRVTDTAISISEGKTKNARRTIPLSDRAKAALAAVKKQFPSDLPQVFTRHEGRHTMTEGLLTHVFKAAVRKAGLSEECVLYSTRHTFCTRLGKAGASPYVLQKLAGHGDIHISSRYCHPDAEQLEEAIGMLNGKKVAGE